MKKSSKGNFGGFFSGLGPHSGGNEGVDRARDALLFTLHPEHCQRISVPEEYDICAGKYR